MAPISLRLSDELEKRLAAEAAIEGKPRSEVLRGAIVDYLARRERERFMREMVSAAQALACESQAREEAAAIAEEFFPLENEALAIAEGRKPGESWPEDVGNKWWK